MRQFNATGISTRCGASSRTEKAAFAIRGFFLAAMFSTAFAVLFLCPILAHAQTAATGAISGKVTNPSGGVLANVLVTATNKDTSQAHKEKTGADIQHIPYRGSPQALEDLLGGQIDVVASNLPSVLSAVQGKLIVPLAMTTAQRSPLVPDVPTLAEAGVAGIDVTSWYGMLAPHGTPSEIRDAIFTVTRDVLSTPAMQDKLTAQGLSVTIETPDELAARIKRETALWADVIHKEHITIQ